MAKFLFTMLPTNDLGIARSPADRGHTEYGCSPSASTRISLGGHLSGMSFAFVRNVHWFPDICLQFAIQAIFAGDLRLAILNRLPSHGQRNRATEFTRIRK